jgi:hypothetical protein
MEGQLDVEIAMPFIIPCVLKLYGSDPSPDLIRIRSRLKNVKWDGGVRFVCELPKCTA